MIQPGHNPNQVQFHSDVSLCICVCQTRAGRRVASFGPPLAEIRSMFYDCTPPIWFHFLVGHAGDFFDLVSGPAAL